VFLLLRERHITFPSPLCLMVRVPGFTTEMYFASCKVQTKKVDRPCGLVVRVPGYTTEMYCASCEVRTEFIYVMKKKSDLENENTAVGIRRADQVAPSMR
jgi:hypothetical protein